MENDSFVLVPVHSSSKQAGHLPMVIDYQQLVCNYRAKEFFFSNSFNIPLSKLNIYKKKIQSQWKVLSTPILPAETILQDSPLQT